MGEYVAAGLFLFTEQEPSGTTAQFVRMLPASFADETAMTSLSARQMHVSHLSSGPQRFESLIHHNRQLVDDGFTAVEQV